MLKGYDRCALFLKTLKGIFAFDVGKYYYLAKLYSVLILFGIYFWKILSIKYDNKSSLHFQSNYFVSIVNTITVWSIYCFFVSMLWAGDQTKMAAMTTTIEHC